jgi:Lamin Tail Domain/Secretion system C-terminal sorting domain
MLNYYYIFFTLAIQFFNNMQMKKIFTLLVVLLFTKFSYAQSITFSEINYKSDSTRDCGDWVELHNYGATVINLSNWELIDTGFNSTAYQIPSGTNLAAGAYLVIYRQLAKFNLYYPSVANKIGPFSYKINSTDRILLKNASGATILTAQCNNSKGWPKGAHGEGRTMELINQNSNANLTDSFAWRDGCMLGSPGGAPVLCNDPIVFSEINYNSDSLADQGEFIELHNTTAAAINISNYFVRDGVDSFLHIFRFPVGTILPADGYLVLSNDTAAFRKYWPNVNPLFGNMAFSFSNGGELVRLFDANNAMKFSVHYNDTLPWTDSADGMGYTLELKDKNGFMNDGTNWFAGCRMGSPGKKFTSPCVPVYPVGINKIGKLEFILSPNPFNDFFEINCNENENYDLQIMDAVGKIIFKENIRNNKRINTSLFTKGIYYVSLKNSNGQIATKKLIKL